jgi:hypothetical protein
LGLADVAVYECALLRRHPWNAANAFGDGCELQSVRDSTA